MTSTEPAGGFAGTPDAFQRLWTPHRMAYIEGENKPAAPDADMCPFCRAPGRSDDDGLIVHRGATCFVVLNLYPYNPGHLLVCPYRHVAGYVDLTQEERDEFGDLTAQAMRVIGRVSAPNGFNTGMNQGEAAGAGIAAHLHQHVVPRWSGDSNFFPIVAQTKAVPVMLGETRRVLAAAWGEL